MKKGKFILGLLVLLNFVACDVTVEDLNSTIVGTWVFSHEQNSQEMLFNEDGTFVFTLTDPTMDPPTQTQTGNWTISKSEQINLLTLAKGDGGDTAMSESGGAIEGDSKKNPPLFFSFKWNNQVLTVVNSESKAHDFRRVPDSSSSEE